MAEKSEKIRISGAIFDLDGTLLDSTSVWDDFADRFFDGTGIEPPKDLRSKISAMTLPACADFVKESYNLPGTREELMDKVNRPLVDYYANRVAPKKGAVEFVRRLKENGIPMCVASATDAGLCRLGLERTGMADCISEVVSCTDTGLSKTTPAIFEYCVKKIGSVRETTVVFEDALHAVRTAHEGGFKVAAIDEPYEAPRKEQILRFCDLYLPDFVNAERFFLFEPPGT